MNDSDKTPVPGAAPITLESLNTELQAQRANTVKFEAEVRRRLSEIEREDVANTVNLHAEKIIELELGQKNIIEALDELKAQSVKTQTWLTGIEKKTDDTNETVHRTETVVRQMFAQLIKK